VWAAIETVEDPELPLSIVDMGLVYDVQVEDRAGGALVTVDMTFTAMGCPAMDLLRSDVQEAIGALDGVDEVQVNVVWSPPWTTKRLSERARAVLETTGVSV
jgi:metal-sulfur cluster biosynthetic enzyme